MKIKIIQLIILLLVVLFLFVLGYVVQSLFLQPIKSVENYDKCFQSVQYPDKIQHFPNATTANLKNASFYCYPGTTKESSELVLLALKMDKDFIQRELNSYSFLNSNTPIGAKQKIYNMPSDFVGINNQDLTYYVLKNDYNFKEEEEYFPYFTGIGVSKNMDTILYYYIRPD